MSSLQDAIVGLVGSPWVFAAVGVVLLVGSVLVFLPSQGLVAAVGSLLLARHGDTLQTGVLIVVAAAGMTLGDLGLFASARRAALSEHAWFDKPKVRRAREGLESRYADAPMRIAVLGRFVPVGRLTTNLIGADSDLSLARFAAAASAANVLWAAYCIGVAAAFGAWSRQNPLLVTALAVTASILIGLLVTGIERARQHSTA
jgi:membrane-associated protein